MGTVEITDIETRKTWVQIRDQEPDMGLVAQNLDAVRAAFRAINGDNTRTVNAPEQPQLIDSIGLTSETQEAV